MDDSDKRELLGVMLTSRRLHEKELEVIEAGEDPPYWTHSGLGQEAVGAGAPFALEDRDYVFISHRTWGPLLLRLPLEEIVAGLYGTRSSPSSGRVSKIGDARIGLFQYTGMIGQEINPAVGTALASKIRGDDRVTLVFFGDGATNRGEFHTALNFATVKEVPVVFVIENNRMVGRTSIDELTAVDDLIELAGHGLPRRVVDGQDVLEVYENTSEAVERARRGDGPTIIEAKTSRFRPHNEASPETRPAEEIERLRERDPVEAFRSELLEEGVITEEEIERMRARIGSEVDEAFEFVEEDPMPDEEDMERVYAGTDVFEGLSDEEVM